MKHSQPLKNIDLSLTHQNIARLSKDKHKLCPSPLKLHFRTKSNLPLHAVSSLTLNLSRSPEHDSYRQLTDREHPICEFDYTHSVKDKLPKDQFNISSYVRMKPNSEIGLIGIPNEHTLVLGNNAFRFDHVLTSEASQKYVYDHVGSSLVAKFMEGYNTTIFAYGSTGSGKTYTMFGSALDGVVPRAISDIFARKNDSFELSCSMLEIYRETLIDLLVERGDQGDLKVGKSSYVINLSRHSLKNQPDTLKILQKGNTQKKMRETCINERSSRSHVVFTLYLEGPFGCCRLNMVDLAGSEKISRSKVYGYGLEYTKKINLSLSCLGNTICALVKGNEHVPYRYSKLTMVLRYSLMGNSLTSLIVTCAPDSQCLDETISSLKFAQRACKVQTQAQNAETVSKYNTLKRLSLQQLQADYKYVQMSVRRVKDYIEYCGCVCCAAMSALLKDYCIRKEESMKKYYSAHKYDSIKNEYFQHLHDKHSKYRYIYTVKTHNLYQKIKQLYADNNILKYKIISLEESLKRQSYKKLPKSANKYNQYEVSKDIEVSISVFHKEYALKQVIVQLYATSARLRSDLNPSYRYILIYQINHLQDIVIQRHPLKYSLDSTLDKSLKLILKLQETYSTLINDLLGLLKVSNQDEQRQLAEYKYLQFRALYANLYRYIKRSVFLYYITVKSKQVRTIDLRTPRGKKLR